jgi:hypothetical protein
MKSRRMIGAVHVARTTMKNAYKIVVVDIKERDNLEKRDIGGPYKFYLNEIWCETLD